MNRARWAVFGLQAVGLTVVNNAEALVDLRGATGLAIGNLVCEGHFAGLGSAKVHAAGGITSLVDRPVHRLRDQVATVIVGLVVAVFTVPTSAAVGSVFLKHGVRRGVHVEQPAAVAPGTCVGIHTLPLNLYV